MRQFLFGLLVCTTCFLQAQVTCTPDSTISGAGVYPPPYIVDSVGSGIPVSACIGSPFYYTFTISNNGPFNYNGFNVNLDTVTIFNPGGIDNLPVGLEYVCNPPSCQFPFGTLGCAAIYGTAGGVNTPGDFSLIINGQINVLGNAVPVTFPGALAAGEYILPLLPNGNPDCYIQDYTSSEDHLLGTVFSNSPNPFSDVTRLKVYAQEAGAAQLMVTTTMGQTVHLSDVVLSIGENTVTFDGASLPEGIYIYTFKRGSKSVSGKMSIVR